MQLLDIRSTGENETMNSNELKLLVTDKYYRWAKLEKLKLKILKSIVFAWHC